MERPSCSRAELTPYLMALSSVQKVLSEERCAGTGALLIFFFKFKNDYVCSFAL